METRDRMNGAAALNPILFALRDQATGVVRPIRDMTDQEIERHAKACAEEMARQQAALRQAIAQVIEEGTRAIVGVKGVMAALHYEAHRRTQSLIVPH
jgi:hypothetical protein